MSYSDYVPFSAAEDLPPPNEMDKMIMEEQRRGHQRAFQVGLEHRIENIESKLDMLANILFANREILQGGLIPDLGAGHKPPPVKKSSFEDKLKQKEEQERQVKDQGTHSLLPQEAKDGLID